jgi:mycothiol synthase
MTLTLREAVDDDAPAIAAFLAEHAAALQETAPPDAAEVQQWLTQPNLWISVVEHGGRIVGYADVTDRGARGQRIHIDARALDEAVAKELVASAEEYARSLPEAAGAALRGYANERDEILGQVYARAGYAIVRHSFEMEIDLAADPPAPVWPDGISIRTYRADDDERVYQASQEAFADHWDFHPSPIEEWRRWGPTHPRFDPELWFLAEDGDEIAGLSLCGRHWSGEPTFGWVHSLSVRRPWRRRGLARALLLHSFAQLGRRGATRVGLGVDAENTTGAVRLYERAGMHVVQRNDTYEKTL